MLAALQWIVLGVLSFVSREAIPKFGLRDVDKRLSISSVVLAAIWLACLGNFRHSATIEASMISSDTVQSCAAAKEKAPAREVRRLMGEPDHRVSEEDVRGPGAERWDYTLSQCQIHLLDGVVTSVN